MSTSEKTEKSETSEKNDVSAPMNPNASSKEMAMKYISLAIDNSPKEVQPYIKKIQPIVLKAIDLAEKLAPILQKLYEKIMELWKKVEPYRPELLAPAFMGFIMCFFGGSFLTLIAAVEAFNMCGYESTMNCINMLVEDFKIVIEENKKDDSEDLDKDGVPDVLQVSNAKLLTRKTLLFLKVVDPNRVTLALSGITAGAMAVVASLKLRFAKTITLGNAIANTIQKPADQFLLPHIERALPEEYKKWGRPVLTYTIKSIAVSIAWTVQRILSAFHSAMRGGLMFSRNIMEYLSEMNYMKINHEESVLDEIVGYGLALVGLYFQLAFGFGLPFPLNILLFPFTIVEYLLIWMVNK
mmetsp:Transcript_27054/g.54183  ORF Transcript_27054/g.54183 Transcript_27054/m.54183 type:complete len:354 (+) Transcript_27054:121-1182(+)|eukprot:CAMPEP_0170379350 /NCGR_PEP_ID=MMETSP0117_2-20130122/13298_1 /TAXON_ID=400756 /ORGANISM="Durinskia baltica, Strain CSIRO CS-38" /LENGTH=353 /DNA_ID=CAMNT_0010634787 /DNA_START=97 /DNA_END=1158 /DNA_ORIENTATION=+